MAKPTKAEYDGIRARARKAGFKPNRADVLATYKRHHKPKALPKPPAKVTGPARVTGHITGTNVTGPARVTGHITGSGKTNVPRPAGKAKIPPMRELPPKPTHGRPSPGPALNGNLPKPTHGRPSPGPALNGNPPVKARMTVKGYATGPKKGLMDGGGGGGRIPNGIGALPGKSGSAPGRMRGNPTPGKVGFPEKSPVKRIAKR